MGLCKCPKRKVTNLFCFEHRVNVCEYCLVDSHPNCVVQSYLNWLTDSDYEPNCFLCQQSLSEGETIRLNCLHILHFNCFDEWGSKFPPTTAPAGYRCPCCNSDVFPPINEISPLIEKLREQLKQCNWARGALGLPALPELNRPRPVNNIQHSNVNQENNHNKPNRVSSPPTRLEMDDIASYSVSNSDATFSRKKYQSYDQYPDTKPLIENNRDVDNEANKYKRRPVMEWFRGLWRAKYGNSANNDKVSGKRKLLFLIFLMFMFIITMIIVLKRAGVSNDNDPMFDPLANPNIRVAAENSRV